MPPTISGFTTLPVSRLTSPMGREV
jgi:hypothetical protein